MACFVSPTRKRGTRHPSLYDLARDLGEANDLSKQRPNVAKELREELRAWLKSVPAEVPGDNPQYDEKKALKEVKK
jgi:hypothetical protein